MKKALYSLFVILLVASMSACKGNKAERQADEWLARRQRRLLFHRILVLVLRLHRAVTATRHCRTA